MAVSPSLRVQSADKPTGAASKAQLVVAAGRSSKSINGEKQLSRDTGKDFAEQLNEETKRKYVKGKFLGEGTYATVYSGHESANPSSKVAIKKIKVNAEYRDGLTVDAIREVKHLQELSHPNIIALHAVFSWKDQNLNLVLEYLPCGDLEMLIRATGQDGKTEAVNYSMKDVKAWMGMLCRAVWFCHENFVLHRDIKPNNLLIGADGELKLADFGLARSFADPYQPMTHNVITRWYRPPELFYRAKYYSGAVDVWSVGMVFAELLKRAPYLPGDTDIQQIRLISEYIGTPVEENWPGVSKLEGYVPYDRKDIHPVRTARDFEREFGGAGPDGVSLLMSMLALDPRKRPTARGMLQHEYWTNDPMPSKKEDLPRKAGGEKKMGEDLKRRGGEVEDGRADKVARKLEFTSKK